MTDSKKIRDLTEQEFIALIERSTKGNHIEISGVQVNSTTENLKNVETTINRLVNKHKNFLLLRKELKLKTGYPD
tara:strand:- start:67 stop:291 length:225 start_codon:yes stop_codon:yes gene_type:complete